MAFTFTVKLWENSRPSKAKGSGVAKGITAVQAATRKAPSTMNESEVEAARKAIDQLITAFDTASGKLRGERDNKSVTTSMALTQWRKECSDYLDTLRKRVYAINRDKFVNEFNQGYAANRDKLVAAHTAAAQTRRAIANGGAAPTNKIVMDWFNAARDMGRFTSKTEIAKLQVTGIPKGSIRVEDVPLPPDLNATKTKIKELTGWLDEFAKGAKTAGRAAGAGLSDTNAVEKELKDILAEYLKIEKAMKPVIQQAKLLATQAKQKADAMKAVVQQSNTDERVIKPLVKDLHDIKTQAEQLDAEVVRLNYPYRESDGAIAKRASNWRKMPGFDATRHAPILQKRQEASFMGIRLATMPLAEARKQVDRAKDLMGKSTNHRGYASAI
ncbi:MAG TPA: hypothetical protein VKB75_08465 [Jatrophihabitans sp.]|nr:hypothetical protein [Jatrophihabitans sp.]